MGNATHLQGCRVLIVGPGNISRVFLRLIAQFGDNLTGVIASSFPSSCHHAHTLKNGGNHDKVVAYPSVKSAIDTGTIDGVILSSPATAHLADLDVLLPMGIPILCEKPLVGFNDYTLELSKTLKQRWRDYLDTPFVFNASNYTLMKAVINAAQAKDFFFSFYTNGTHRGVAIIEDLMPHCVSFIQKLMGQAEATIETCVIEEHKCSGIFRYDNHRIIFDFAQSPNISKRLSFGFDRHIYNRIQEGAGGTYKVGVQGPFPSQDAKPPIRYCVDPFEVSYKRFQDYMLAYKKSNHSLQNQSVGDLVWALENQRLCCELIHGIQTIGQNS